MVNIDNDSGSNNYMEVEKRLELPIAYTQIHTNNNNTD